MANFASGKNHHGYKHGATVGGHTKEYRAWQHMKSRCYNKNVERYHLYGGRGIKVCDEWLNSFESFLSHIGLAPDASLQVDRIDNNADYKPGNVRWASVSDNVKNSSRARYIEFSGKRKTLGEWAQYLGVSRTTLQMRLDKYGWGVERTLSTKAMGKFGRGA
jgi:hypothetical protein